MKCPNPDCGAEIQVPYKHCPNCGHPLPLQGMRLEWNSNRLYMENYNNIFECKVSLSREEKEPARNLVLTLEPYPPNLFEIPMMPRGINELDPGSEKEINFVGKIADGQAGNCMIKLKLTYDDSKERKNLVSSVEQKIRVFDQPSEDSGNVLNYFNTVIDAHHGADVDVTQRNEELREKIKAEQIKSINDLLTMELTPNWVVVPMELIAAEPALKRQKRISWHGRPRALDSKSMSSKPSFKRKFEPFHTQGQISATLVVRDDTIYVPNNNSKVYAINAKDGTLKWEASLDNRKSSLNWSPAVTAQQSIITRTCSDDIVALDSQEGREIWRKTIQGLSSDLSIILDYLYVGTNEGLLHQIDLSNGEIVRTIDTETGEAIIGRIALYAELLALATRSAFCFFNMSTGEPENIYRTKEGFISCSPSSSENEAICAVEYPHPDAPPGELIVLDAGEHGSIRKSGEAQLKGIPVGDPIFADQKIYIACRNGNVYRYEKYKTRPGIKLDWEVDIKMPIYTSMALSHNFLFVAATARNKGKLICLDAENGKELDSQEIDGTLSSPPMVAAGAVYISSHSGFVYGFRIF